MSLPVLIRIAEKRWLVGRMCAAGKGTGRPGPASGPDPALLPAHRAVDVRPGLSRSRRRPARPARRAASRPPASQKPFGTPASWPPPPRTCRLAMTPAWLRSAFRSPSASPSGRHADEPRHPRPGIRLVTMATTPPGLRPMAPLPRPSPSRPRHLTSEHCPRASASSPARGRATLPSRPGLRARDDVVGGPASAAWWHPWRPHAELTAVPLHVWHSHPGFRRARRDACRSRSGRGDAGAAWQGQPQARRSHRQPGEVLVLVGHYRRGNTVSPLASRSRRPASCQFQPYLDQSAGGSGQSAGRPAVSSRRVTSGRPSVSYPVYPRCQRFG